MAIQQRKKPNYWRLALLVALLAGVIVAIILLPDGKTTTTAAEAATVPAQEQAVTDQAALPAIDPSFLVKAGQKAPDFRVEMLDGKTFTLASLEGKVVLLTFWATWCPFCLEELEVLPGKLAAFEGKDFVFLPISWGEKREVVEAFVKKVGYTFPVALDSDKKIFPLFAPSGIPRCVLIGKDGKVLTATIGFDKNDPTETDALVALIEKNL